MGGSATSSGRGATGTGGVAGAFPFPLFANALLSSTSAASSIFHFMYLHPQVHFSNQERGRQAEVDPGRMQRVSIALCQRFAVGFGGDLPASLVCILADRGSSIAQERNAEPTGWLSWRGSAGVNFKWR
jgi:hypothetical protein